MDILIESTREFEKDLASFNEAEKAAVIQKINDYANLFQTQKSDVEQKLRRLSLPSSLNGYESSLYTLEVTQKLKVILAIDEDPIFGQVIFTLFRAVQDNAFYQAYQDVAKFLYQELLHHKREAAHIS